MTDLELARAGLSGHTLALCRGGQVIVSDARGVAPMVDFIREGRRLDGYCAADRVVGRAAAMLFVSAGIVEVYAETMSKGALTLLSSHGIPASFGQLTDRIINRAGTGPCPMELVISTVSDSDIAVGVERIFQRLDELRHGSTQ